VGRRGPFVVLKKCGAPGIKTSAKGGGEENEPVRRDTRFRPERQGKEKMFNDTGSASVRMKIGQKAFDTHVDPEGTSGGDADGRLRRRVEQLDRRGPSKAKE